MKVNAAPTEYLVIADVGDDIHELPVRASGWEITEGVVNFVDEHGETAGAVPLARLYYFGRDRPDSDT